MVALGRSNIELGEAYLSLSSPGSVFSSLSVSLAVLGLVAVEALGVNDVAVRAVLKTADRAERDEGECRLSFTGVDFNEFEGLASEDCVGDLGSSKSSSKLLDCLSVA
mmetsp:Transcript_27379/g.49289  ORF Transcript_27379/g.49289 Transcript_27379/m.49289 type:complete len:108 (+) Transcript_27379:383-706(+)